MCGEAVLYPVRVGSPWRDLPADCGTWDTVYQRFRTWAHQGLWAALWRRGQPGSGEAKLWAALSGDATLLRAHPQAAGAAPKGAVRKPRPVGAPGVAAPPSCTPSAWMTRPASGSPGPAARGRTGRGAQGLGAVALVPYALAPQVPGQSEYGWTVVHVAGREGPGPDRKLMPLPLRLEPRADIVNRAEARIESWRTPRDFRARSRPVSAAAAVAGRGIRSAVAPCLGTPPGDGVGTAGLG